LTVTSTRPDRPKISGLPWETLGDVLRGSAANVRLAILDCCFAGQATETLAGGGELGLADIAHVEGVYTLAATTRNRAAHVLPPAQQDTAGTSFTRGTAGPDPVRCSGQGAAVDLRRHLPGVAPAATSQGPARSQPARHQRGRHVLFLRQRRGSHGTRSQRRR